MKRPVRIISFFILILAISAFASLALGAVGLSKNILILRALRVVMGIIVGAGLASCGAVFQAVLRNPLSEPYILGVSSGAGLGAILWTALFGSAVFLPLPAFIGAIVTIFFVYNLAKSGGTVSVQGLLLAGVVINIVFSSMILFFVSTAQNSVLHDVSWWLLGNLQVFDVRLLAAVSALTVAGIFIFLAYTRELNAIAIGEEEAIHLGIDIEKTKKILFVVTSVITAALVSTCGLIGFVGLMVPHIARLLVGANHKTLIPASAILGAIFLIISDAAARVLMRPAEIPIGVVTSFLGGPFFLFLLKRSGRGRPR